MATGDKDGVGTSLTRDSKVWYTLTGGSLSEVYYPTGDSPNVRSLDFAVTDGHSLTQRETDASVTRSVALIDQKSLTYRQISTDKAGRWRLVKTYVTDPARSSVAIDIRFTVLKGGALQLFALYDPSLASSAQGDSGRSAAQGSGSALLSEDVTGTAPVGSALVSSTGFLRSTTGYVGSVSDPVTQLASAHALATTYASATPGNIGQAGQVRTTGTDTHVTLALGFGPNAGSALRDRAVHGARGLPDRAARLPVRLALLPRRAAARAREGHRSLRDPVLRVADDGARPRGQDLPGRLHRLADPPLGSGGQRHDGEAAAATTSSGPATSTSRSTGLLAAGDTGRRTTR